MNKAKQDFVAAIERKPDSPIAHLNLGSIHLVQKDLSNALISLNEALRLDEKFVRALYVRSQIYVKQDKVKLALNDLISASNLAPKNREILRLIKRLRAGE